MSDRERDAIDPTTEARVRRLLGEARVDPATEALPADVAARLEATLATLGAERATERATEPDDAPAPDAPVVDLTARRRRRTAGLLLAAAAIVVAAIGVGQVIGDGPGAGGDASTAEVDSASGADRGEAEDRDEGQALPGNEFAPPAPSQAAPTPQAPNAPAAGAQSETLDELAATARIRPARFTDDVRAVRRALGAPRDGVARPVPRALPDALAVRQRIDCAGTPLADGVRVAVVYDGSPALLLLRPPTGGAQVADLVQCGTGETLRSTTLSVR